MSPRFIKGACIALLTLFFTGGATAQSGSSLSRSFVDRVDDFYGPQVHLLYVIPSDGVDRQLDTNGTMSGTIVRVQHWLANQTQGQSLKVDTHQGQPDITYVQLPHADSQVAMNTAYPLDVMGQDLVKAGFSNPDKVYAVFYDGHSNWSCGGAKSPALPKLGAMFLLAHPTGDLRPCSDAPGIGSGLGQPQYFEIGLLHEIFHTIGFVPACAPHVTAVDHVNDNPSDVLYHPDAVSSAGWDWQHAVLDYNYDDYYGEHTPSGCPNLKNSPYLTSGAFVRLTVSIRGKGRVRSSQLGPCLPSASCQKWIAKATQRDLLRLVAEPAVGWRFARWRGLCRGIRPTCNLTVNQSGTILAVFTRKSAKQ